MFFDPLTSWLVVLIADSISASSNHVSNAQMAEHYRNSAKRTNSIMNGSILALRNKGYVSAEYALRDIKVYVEWAQKSYEISHGYAKLEISRESFEFIIKLCEECKAKFSNDYETYSRIYDERLARGDSEESLKKLRETVGSLQVKVESYRHILDIANKGRTSVIEQEEERARKLADSDSNGVVLLKSILVIGLCIGGFAIMMSAGGLIGALALIGAAIGGYFILK